MQPVSPTVVDLTVDADDGAAALPNPHDGHSHVVLRLAAELAGHGGRPAGPALAVLERALDAEAACVVRAESGQVAVLEAPSEADAEAAAGWLAASGAVRRLVRLARADERGTLGFFSPSEPARPGRCSMVVPLRRQGDGPLDALVVHRLPASLTGGLGETLASMLRAFLATFDEPDAALAELRILSELRRRWGRQPNEVYDRAFALFRSRLADVHMVFEPIVTLGTRPQHIGIVGWEALARLGEGGDGAPQALFEAAAVWGDEFVVELDSTLADRALGQFLAAWERSGLPGAVPPLSINVSPRSVWSDRYVQRLRASMRSHDLGPRRLTLELSEKEPIVRAGSDVRLGDAPDALALFRERARSLARQLEIGFAIDDFGAGHASLDRLSTLLLSHVKVDRAILHHADADVELRFVLELAIRRGILDKVVIEGVDDQCPLSLPELWEIGVRFIQGYITERGTGALAHLRPETTHRLAALVRGELRQLPR
ncbi:MAG: EAL domain-containing protein [Acidimicrobiia bacterium]